MALTRATAETSRLAAELEAAKKELAQAQARGGVLEASLLAAQVKGRDVIVAAARGILGYVLICGGGMGRNVWRSC